MDIDAPPTPDPHLSDLFDAETVERLIRAISSALCEAVVIAGPTGQIIWHNPVAPALFEMTSAELLERELVDQRWHAITLDGAPYPLTETRSQLRETGLGIAAAPIGIRTGAGRLKWMSTAVTPLVVGGQRHTLVVFSDVSDQIAERRTLKYTLDALRHSLAPTELPTSDVVRFAAGRRDGNGDSIVGADFYGVGVDGENARFTVGDCSGTGARAVELSVTALNTMRAISGMMASTADAIDRLDTVFDNEDPHYRVTTVSGRIEMVHRIPTLSMVCAGHALPILIRDGRATEIGSVAPMIGVQTESGRTATRHELRSGDIFISYTDGLTDTVQPRLAADELLERIPVNVPVESVVDTLMRMFDASSSGEQGVVVFGFEVA